MNRPSTARQLTLLAGALAVAAGPAPMFRERARPAHGRRIKSRSGARRRAKIHAMIRMSNEERDPDLVKRRYEEACGRVVVLEDVEIPLERLEGLRRA